MATVATSNLCIICGTKVYFGEDTTLINSRKEICFKFTTFVSRYLNFEPTEETYNYYNSNLFNVEDIKFNNVENNNSRKDSICCFTCLAKVEVFCETYHKLECYQLKIFHILESLSKLMEVTSSTVRHKFQEEFISKVQNQRRRHGPFARLDKINESELQLLQKSHTTEAVLTESSHILIKTEMQQDELEEGDLRCSNDDDDYGASNDEPNSQFQLEQHFEKIEPKQEKCKLNLEASDDATNQMDIGNNYLVKIKFENISPQKAVSANSKRKTKPHKPRQCLMCGKTFPKFHVLCRHVRSHIREKVLHCRICLQEFGEKQGFTKHKITEHLNGGVECDICRKSVENIESHCQQTHKPVAKVFCEQCGKTFKSENVLKRHETSCRAVNVYKSKNAQQLEVSLYEKTFRACDICGLKFNNFGNNLRRHIARVHGKEKAKRKYKCPHSPCKHMCRDKHQLVRHIRTHTGERPFQCDQCERLFKQKVSLDRHMERHSGIKTFSCEVCGQSFLHRHNLKRHEKTHEKI